MTAEAVERAVEMVEQLERLRAPFEQHQISKLPKNVAKDGQAQSCNVCGGWHKRAALHLDYVGHAAVTDRLLDVDPFWSWEPAGVDEHGQPVFMRNGTGVPIGLWIKLTIHGVTRWGYGSVEPGKPEAVKELIGDAIRNAAMRFGVALDLWHKGDLHGEDETTPAPEPEPQRITQEHQALLDQLESVLASVAEAGVEIDADAARRHAVNSPDHAVAAINAARQKLPLEQVPF